MLPAEPAWTLLLDSPPVAGGAMDARHVYVPLQVGELRAFDRQSGALIWTASVSATSAPVVGEGLVAIATSEALEAFDALTGARRWRTSLESALTSPLVLDTGWLLASSGDAFLAVRMADGQLMWRRPLGAASRHAAGTAGLAQVAVVLDDGRVMALALASGEVMWERRLPGTLSAPSMASDRVLVGSTNNFFYALDALSGDDRWTWRTGGDVVGSASDEDRVYFVALDNLLRGVNRDNGNQRWKAAVPTRPSVPPIVAGETVVLAGVSPRLEAYSARTGASVGSYTAPSELQGPPLIDAAPQPFEVAVVAITRDGRVVGLRPVQLLFRDPPAVPLTTLPGRELPPERPPQPPS